MADYMKEPCEHCPYRHDVNPFLSLARGIELANHTCNPYNDFPCHKTTISNDDGDYRYKTDKSKECAGFITLQHYQTGCRLPDGFKLSPLAYEDRLDMIDNYEQAEEDKQ